MKTQRGTLAGGDDADVYDSFYTAGSGFLSCYPNITLTMREMAQQRMEALLL